LARCAFFLEAIRILVRQQKNRLLSGLDFGDVQLGAGGAAEGNDSVSAAVVLWRRAGLRTE
jgi:hypothetical protein